MRERNEMASNKSNKAYPSSSKLSDADKSSEKIDVDVFEQPKVEFQLNLNLSCHCLDIK